MCIRDSLVSVAVVAAMAFGQYMAAGVIVIIAFAYNLFGLSQHRSMVLGALAIFLYVGGEVAIGSFLVNYFAESSIAGMEIAEAGEMVGYYWGAAMVGRLVGAFLMNYIASTKYLAANAAIAGLTRCVLPPGPCLPSKFLFDVEAHLSLGFT